jgi:hypothetical protein
MLVPSWWQVRAFDRLNQVVAAKGRPSNSSVFYIEDDSWAGCQQLSRLSSYGVTWPAVFLVATGKAGQNALTQAEQRASIVQPTLDAVRQFEARSNIAHDYPLPEIDLIDN